MTDGRNVAAQHLLDVAAFALRQALQPAVPGRVSALAAFSGCTPRGENLIRNDEGRVGPVELDARSCDLVLAERRTVRFFRTLLVRRAKADDGFAGDERGFVALLRFRNRRLDLRRVVAIDAASVPAGRLEALNLVDRGREARCAVDGDRVVIEQHDQLAQLEVARKVDGFVADAFHEAAIAHERISIVIGNRVAETRVHEALGDCHADSGRDALAERTGRRLDPWSVIVLRMPGGDAAKLPEVLQLLDRHLRIAGEIEQRVEQHGAVAGRKHEAVAVGPVRRARVELQKLREEHGRDIGHAHGHAGMPGVRGLHGIHGQRADRIGHFAGGRRCASFRRLIVSEVGHVFLYFHEARRFSSTSRWIMGVRISCMARSSLPPGMTMEFARLMKLSPIIVLR